MAESSTDAVVDSLRQCQGLLQIVTKGSPWIEAEKFGARVLGIPSIRLVASKAPLSIDKDRYSLTFDLEVSDRELERVFENALRKLVNTMRHPAL